MNFHNTQPIYIQIGDYVCEQLLQNSWHDGEKIPSVREIATATEVNPNTVMRAFSYLQNKGILMNQRGIGYFVADKAYQKTLELKKEQFIVEELPLVFKTMNLLNLTFRDLEDLYEETRATGLNNETK